ncbi:MAG: membrane protein YdbS with pleckstrin-like domain [Alphaproteobacteria bacterium]|jgi:membrane protein YdbS with pleckstrin-like domain
MFIGTFVLSEITSTHNADPEFTNNTIAANTISTENIALASLSPKYRQINLIWGACFGVLLALIFATVTSGFFFELPEEIKPYVIWGYVFIGFITLRDLIYHFLADPLMQYALREHDLNYQSGLIFRSLVSQPILRIQHIEIKRGPIERKAGLATLQVFSAGGMSHTFNIPGLVYEDAIALRQFILDHKDLAADV